MSSTIPLPPREQLYNFIIDTAVINTRGQVIYHKSSPPRVWEGCTFGADLRVRVCGLWVRSRSLAANHAGGPSYILVPA